jgi:hypothetical protein
MMSEHFFLFAGTHGLFQKTNREGDHEIKSWLKDNLLTVNILRHFLGYIFFLYYAAKGTKQVLLSCQTIVIWLLVVGVNHVSMLPQLSRERKLLLIPPTSVFPSRLLPHVNRAWSGICWASAWTVSSSCRMSSVHKVNNSWHLIQKTWKKNFHHILHIIRILSANGTWKAT